MNELQLNIHCIGLRSVLSFKPPFEEKVFSAFFTTMTPPSWIDTYSKDDRDAIQTTSLFLLCGCRIHIHSAHYPFVQVEHCWPMWLDIDTRCDLKREISSSQMWALWFPPKLWFGDWLRWLVFLYLAMYLYRIFPLTHRGETLVLQTWAAPYPPKLWLGVDHNIAPTLRKVPVSNGGFKQHPDWVRTHRVLSHLVKEEVQSKY